MFRFTPAAVSVATLFVTTSATAHYGMIIPSDPMLSQDDGRSVDLTLSFSHPFEEDGMMLERPEAFTVTHAGERTDLLGTCPRRRSWASPATR